MKLTVPTNWQSDLITKIDKDNVKVIYGKLDRDFFGGGRPSCIFLKVKKSQVEEQIKEIHSNGLRFNYLLNATCLNNQEWSRYGQRQLRVLLDWLSSIHADGIVVAIPYIAELIKKRYPHFEISVSCFAQVNSVNKAKFWEDLGASTITLTQVEVNRDFVLLRKIKENIKCQLQLIVNDSCIQDCPMFFYHNNLVSHGSQISAKTGNFTIDYCRLVCRYRMISNPEYLIRAAWIRPEDICVYEDIGIDNFKLVDRNMATDSIVLIVDAYTKRRYNGNLYDLFSNPSKSLWLRKSNYPHKFKYFLHPFTVNVFKLLKQKRVLRDVDIYIDNRKLDGFINHFLKESCRDKSCDKCRYCHGIAQKIVSMNPESREDTIKGYGKFIEESISGGIFKYKIF